MEELKKDEFEGMSNEEIIATLDVDKKKNKTHIFTVLAGVIFIVIITIICLVLVFVLEPIPMPSESGESVSKILNHFLTFFI